MALATAKRRRTKKFRPSVDGLEGRSLMSTFGGGNIDYSIPRLNLPKGNLNLTSNTFNDVNNRISNTVQSIINNPSATNVQTQINNLVVRLPNGVTNLSPILLADLQTFQKGTDSVTPEQADAIVENLFEALLDRPVNSPEFSAFAVTGLQNGTLTVAGLTSIITTSPEYVFGNITDGASPFDNQTQLVTALYNEVLGREPEEAGLDYWIDQLNTGQISPFAIGAAFANSPEAATSPNSIVVQNALPVTPPTYYYGAPGANGVITGNFGTSSSTSTQLKNLIQNDILAYIANGIGKQFNVLKSRINWNSDRLLTYNGKVT